MTPNQSKTARNLLGWNQERLATKAKLGKRTVAAFESGESTRAESVQAMEAAFDKAGITFVDTADQVGVLLAKAPRKERK
jgi:transcriptional regulator with XRE-family HTH domain